MLALKIISYKNTFVCFKQSQICQILHFLVPLPQYNRIVRLVFCVIDIYLQVFVFVCVEHISCRILFSFLLENRVRQAHFYINVLQIFFNNLVPCCSPIGAKGSIGNQWWHWLVSLLKVTNIHKKMESDTPNFTLIQVSYNFWM